MDPLTIVYVDDGSLKTKKATRERFKRYYEAHKDEFKEKNRQRYAEKKKEGWSEEEIARRRDDNRRSYYRRRETILRKTLETLKEKADPSRVCILDELLADNNFSHWGKEVLDVVAFIVSKKNEEGKANEQRGE